MRSHVNTPSICTWRYVALSLLLGLAGCGGGGGGGGAASPPNQPPVAFNACPWISDFNSSATVNLVATDPNGGTLTYTITSGPANGSVSPPSNTTGIFSYTPNIPLPDTGRRGTDKFTFTVTDSGGLTSGPATVTILNSGALRFMPLGDSITTGVGDPSTTSYRRRLFQELVPVIGTGRVNFVGSQQNGSPADFDLDHEGRSGWCDDNNPFCAVSGGQNIAASVSGFLNANPADIILLHIGTNHFDPNNAGVNTILNNISTWAQANYPVSVFVARIIPARDGSLDVNTFNNNLISVTGNRTGVNVFLVDQQGTLQLSGSPNFADSALMADNLHPNQTGYTRMADKWKADMTTAGILPTCP